MNGKGISYASYFAGWFLTWPIIAYMGAQGFTGLVAFLAIPVLFWVRPKSLPLYTVIFIAFMGWIIAASFWSPGAKPFIEGSLLEGTFTMDAVAARVVLTALACVAVLLAIRHVPERTGDKSLNLLRVIGFVQAAGVIVTALLMQPIISLIVSSGQSDPASMTQNLLRNANAFLLLLPFLVAWLWFQGRRGIAAAFVVLSFLAFVRTGTQTAIFGAVFMFGAMALLYWMPRRGMRVLAAGFAGYILLAPLLLATGLAQLRKLGIPMPDSFVSRSYSWELVGQKILEKPITGHGLEASHSWADTYGDHPQWLADMVAVQGLDQSWEQAWSAYRVVPTHPHNMALQVWAETGAIGAVLLAAAILALGWRLKPAFAWSLTSRYAAAGLAGVVLAMFSFAYSMWNEAFWASVALAFAVILLQARRDAA